MKIPCLVVARPGDGSANHDEIKAAFTKVRRKPKRFITGDTDLIDASVRRILAEADDPVRATAAVPALGIAGHRRRSTPRPGAERNTVAAEGRAAS